MITYRGFRVLAPVDGLGVWVDEAVGSDGGWSAQVFFLHFNIFRLDTVLFPSLRFTLDTVIPDGEVDGVRSRLT